MVTEYETNAMPKESTNRLLHRSNLGVVGFGKPVMHKFSGQG